MIKGSTLILAGELVNLVNLIFFYSLLNTPLMTNGVKLRLLLLTEAAFAIRLMSVRETVVNSNNSNNPIQTQ